MPKATRRRPRPYRAEPLEPRVLLATVSGAVYNDNNADGGRLPFGEPGLAGWTVYIDANENGVLDGTELSDLSAAGGAWSITSATFTTRGTYHVRVVPQAGWRPTEPAAGEYAVSFASTSDTVTGRDFGQTRRALVTGTVFHDLDDDGAFDRFDREPGLQGRTVFADANDNAILDAGESSDTTDANGDYALAPAAGAYTIRQVQQAGWWQTFPSPPSAGHPVTLTNAQTVSGRLFGNIGATVDLISVGFAITSQFDPAPGDGRIDVLYQIRNTGTADSGPFQITVYLSDDENVFTADRNVATIQVPNVRRHDTLSATTTINLPAPDPLRTDNRYWVGLYVDSALAVAETVETNNYNQGQLADRYPIFSEADLPSPADGVNVRARPVTLTGFRTSFSSALGDEWIGGYDVDIFAVEIGAGHRVRASFNELTTRHVRIYSPTWQPLTEPDFQVIATTPVSGTYYFTVAHGSVDDPRELQGRGVGPTGPYTLSIDDVTPDYSADSLTFSGDPPGPIPVTLTVRTAGTFGQAVPVDVHIYLSDDTSVTTADRLLATVEDLGFPDGVTSRTVTVNVTLPPTDPYRTDNQYFLGMIVDPQDQVFERSEANNAAYAPSVGILSESAVSRPADPDDLRSTTFLNPGATRTGTIGDEWIGAYDQDAFSYAAEAGERVAFDIDVGAGGLNSHLRLYETTTWTLLAQNDDGAAPGEAAGVESFLVYTFAAAGTYTLIVGGSGNSANRPTLLVGRTPAGTGEYTLTALTDPAGPVNGVVFHDTDFDGVFDTGETGPGGWTVYVDTNDDERRQASEPATVTDAEGAFALTGVRAGDHKLRQEAPAGWVLTTPITAYYPITLVSGQPAGPFNFGNFQGGTISGTVFNDRDSSGARDPGEAGVAGRTVFLDLNNNGVRDLRTVTVAATDGIPLFVGNGGSGRIRMVLSGYGIERVEDVDVSVRMTATGQQRLGSVSLLGPAGEFVQLATRTQGGTFDDEPGGAGRVKPQTPLSVLDGKGVDGRWNLFIDNEFEKLDSNNITVTAWSLELTLSEPFVLTDAAGAYSFAGLRTGDYVVREGPGPTPGWLRTSPADGAIPVSLGYGQVAAGCNFGTREPQLQVAARHLFYNNSAFDGRDPAANAADDLAIATDKTPLAPGSARSFANVTSYTRGINGLMIDVFELPTAPTLADFSFKAPSSFNPGVWVEAPAPSGFAVRDLPGDNHARRVTFTWPDNLLRNVWLQVGVLANAATRRAAPDVAYFGNLVGETPAGGTSAFAIDGADVVATRSAASFSRVGVTNPFDHDRDGFVNIRDQLIVRQSLGNTLRAPLIPAPTPATSAFRLNRVTPITRTAWVAGVLTT